MIRSIPCLLFFCLSAFAAEFHVGPGMELKNPNEVPWERLAAGDQVRIYWRSESYRTKFVLCQRGTADRPIVIQGVPGPNGALPVIDGRDATTRIQLNFWGEDRAVIKIGGANRPADTMPAHLIVRGLEIRSARRPYSFTGRSGLTPYRKNAASIYIEKGENILIENCRLHDSGNGIITGPATTDLTVRACYLFNNGVEKSLYEHNAYIYALGVTFEFNRFGPLRAGCLGNNFKDRSAGLRFACNWVEGGNRCIDLVDASHPRINLDPRYVRSEVMGNVLIKSPAAGNNQVVHFGGDSGKTGQYRRELLFRHNTILSARPANTVLFRRSHIGAKVLCQNNLVYVNTAIGRLSLLNDASLRNSQFAGNWFSQGWRISPGSGSKTLGDNLSGADPGFVDIAGLDFRLRTGSPAIGSGKIGKQPPALFRQYRLHQQAVPRRDLTGGGRPDIGAFSGRR